MGGRQVSAVIELLSGVSMRMLALTLPIALLLPGAEVATDRKLVPKPGLYRSITEPQCSYASTQNRKGLVRYDDRVVAWLRAAHNGGAVPIRHFLAGPRVIQRYLWPVPLRP